MTAQRIPPGPKGHPILGNYSAYLADELTFIETIARDYGDVVRLRFFHFPVFVINNPTDVEDVLVTHNRNFAKPADFTLPLFRGIFGNGLLSSEGDFWRRQRRLAQPAFHRDRITEYGKVMVSYTSDMIDSWTEGQTLDIQREMMVLTLRIALKTLFDLEAENEIAMMSGLSNDLIEMFSLQEKPTWIFHNYLPTRSNRRFRSLTEQLSRIIRRIIAEQRQKGGDSGDLLSMLLQAQDDDGSGMTDQQLRDEVMTLFLAGHETTALMLSWAFYLLSQNPDAEARLASELESVLGSREPSTEDLPELRYTDAVVKETLRLYPPAWAFGRRAVADSEIGGYRFPKGRQVAIFPWVIHRDPRSFDHPNEFRPERWFDEKTRQLPKYAYLPFGGGPRICIGNSFAMMEGSLVLASIARRYRMRLEPGQDVAPWPVFTLRPRNGIRIVLAKRKGLAPEPSAAAVEDRRPERQEALARRG